MEKLFISEEEFNRMIVNQGKALPSDDSKGDSAVDASIEVESGKQFPEQSDEVEELTNEDHGHINTTDITEDTLEEKLNTETHDGRSTWPDPSEIDSVA